MFSIDIACAPENKDLTIAELWEAGCTGITELEETLLRAFFDDDVRAAGLQARFGGMIQPADTRDWVAFAHEYLKPMEIGERIFICPEWRDDPTPPGRIRIKVNAGLAFGTGAHETTRLCLEAIERHLKPGMTVVDVGTGSGILAEAAAKLGAGQVHASDNDPEAVTVARENFQKAGVNVALSLGSAGDFPPSFADLIVANISPAWISDLAAEWPRVLKPGGLAILSGFEANDIARVSAALEAAGARIEGEFGEHEWRMLEVRHAVHNGKVRTGTSSGENAVAGVRPICGRNRAQAGREETGDVHVPRTYSPVWDQSEGLFHGLAQDGQQADGGKAEADQADAAPPDA
jgi:ribosomal protein L11 methyltransferase